MKNLINNQTGAGHILLILAFIVVFVGIAGFSYTRINESKSQETVVSEEAPAVTDDSAVAADDDGSDTDDDHENDTVASETDPTDDLGDDEN
jgi:hypothetical protein